MSRRRPAIFERTAAGDAIGLGYFQVVLGIALFGSSGVFIRSLDLPAPVIVSGQALVACSAFLAVHALSPRRSLRIPHGLPLVLAVSVVLALDHLCFTIGVGQTTVATIVMLAYLYPVFTAILSAKVLGEHVGRRVLVALALALGGTMLVLAPTAGPVDVDVVGAALGLTVALLVSIYRVLLKKIDPDIPTLVLAIYTTALMGVLFAPSLLVFDYAMTPRTLGLLVVSGLVTSTLAGLLVLSGLRKVEAHKAAILSYFEPFVAALLAWIFLAERPGPLGVAGGLLIVVAGYLVLRVAPIPQGAIVQ